MTILLTEAPRAAKPNPLAEAVSALVREAAASELELSPGEIGGMVEAEAIPVRGAPRP